MSPAVGRASTLESRNALKLTEMANIKGISNGYWLVCAAASEVRSEVQGHTISLSQSCQRVDERTNTSLKQTLGADGRNS
eukprot:s1816_g3.t1